MHDPSHGLAEMEDSLVAADAADMHRLLAWYYGSDGPDGPHLPYPIVEDLAA
jgi:hypothetical protein